MIGAMKILLALDGTPSCVLAQRLVAHTPWPDPTVIELLRVQDTAPSAVEFPVEAREEMEHSLILEHETGLRAVAEDLAAPGREIHVRAAHGRPAGTIVAEAARLGADLIVVGSRGRGTLATMVLGSVAADVVDNATCPVLVARTPLVKRVVVADDGTPGATAVGLVRAWPIFRDTDVYVLSVSDVPAMPVAAGPRRHVAATEAMARAVESEREVHRDTARMRAEQLASAGMRASAVERTGDPAEQIILTAIEREADLIVVGSHGRPAVPRLVLGSVARSVLVNAPCSVLVARVPH